MPTGRAAACVECVGLERDTAGLNVLLVEEAGWLRNALELALGLRGDALVATADLDAAQQQMRAGGIDLAIVGRFESGGLESAAVCRALRDAAVLPQVLACVPADAPERVATLVDAGASSFLSIPFDIPQLRARLASAEHLKAALAAFSPQPPAGVAETGAAAGSPHATLLEQALDPVLVLHADGQIAYANTTIEELLGRPAAEIAGESLYTLVHPDDATSALELVSAALGESQRALAQDLRLALPDGTERAVDVRARNLLETPGIEGIVLSLRDITERKRLEEHLERQALYDSLTRLPNRTLFLDYLEHALARSNRRMEPVVVMFCDLDNFKRVNDTHGHAIGDALLSRVGERLRGSLRASDTASRWGGDEFTVLLEDVAGEEDAIVVARRLSTALSAPYIIDEHEVHISVSIGITFSIPTQSRPGDLLRDADVALYRAKSAGKARWEIFDPGIPAVLPPPTTRAPRTPAVAPPRTPDPTPPADDDHPDVDDEPADDDALRLLMRRISALEREAGRLEAELEDERRRDE